MNDEDRQSLTEVVASSRDHLDAAQQSLEAADLPALRRLLGQGCSGIGSALATAWALIEAGEPAAVADEQDADCEEQLTPLGVLRATDSGHMIDVPPEAERDALLAAVLALDGELLPEAAWLVRFVSVMGPVLFDARPAPGACPSYARLALDGRPSEHWRALALALGSSAPDRWYGGDASPVAREEHAEALLRGLDLLYPSDEAPENDGPHRPPVV